MAIVFKDFVTEEFKKVLTALCEYKEFDEDGRLSVFRFMNKYNAESKIFSDRYNELKKDSQEQLKLIDGSEEEKEEKTKQLNAEFTNKLEQLLDCPSELKELDYDKVKKAPLSAIQLDWLKKVLINLPE